MRSLLSLLALLVCLSGVNPAAAAMFRNVEGSGMPPMPASMEAAQAQTPVMPDTVLGAQSVTPNGSTAYKGKDVDVLRSRTDEVGFVLPDASGKLIWTPAPGQAPPAGYADARELRLKMRELAAQLIAGIDPSLRGSVALPVSFVNQDDFTQTSALGRFIAEQMFYEFNQRGFPIREYRMADAITLNEQGEFVLSRSLPPVSVKAPGMVIVAGTYYADRQAVFINARLIRGSDGMVLRTGQLVLQNNILTRRMLAGTGKTLKTGTMNIKDFKITTQPTNLTQIDKGEDLH